MRPEPFAFTITLYGAVYYLVQGAEPGKLMYWIGATVLNIGVMMMRG